MTAYAASTVALGERVFALSIKSVNQKGLRLGLRHPGSAELEAKLRDRIQEHLRRGAVEVAIEASAREATAVEFRQWLEECRSGSLPMPGWGDFFLREQARARGGEAAAALFEREAGVFFSAFDALLQAFDRHRLEEGARLGKCLEEYLSILERKLAGVIKILPAHRDEKLAKLKARLAELAQALDAPARSDLAHECAALLERLDVSEECDRLGSHFTAFRQALGDGEKGGKYLDFLCQEIFREINTLANKAQCAEISLLTLDMRDLLERIREQVQNLE